MKIFVVYGWSDVDRDFHTVYGVYTSGEIANKVVDALIAGLPDEYVISMDEVMLNAPPALDPNTNITINIDGSVELRRVF